MSTAKITLRPPPNVEFVQGYPGIPPGAPDRPQAAVRGSVEVRLGPSGTKAKYVRVELRKIETLPNPPPNAFYSIVGGEAPTVLWQASEEWGVLQSQDIPFHIRIPEVMPPSLSLDKGAGVKYELVGEVCVQGKTSFLRRSKPIVTSTSTPIVIDKHEFHSTWPYYQKPESRQLVHESVQLTVDRTQNCYGPGDRVSVNATIRSDALHTVILRGFEFTLKETTVFTAGLQGHSKKYQPTVKINIIGEQKLPVNATLYGGMTHRSELSVFIPDSHTTTTINSAKHIDITYVLQVKALMGTGKPLIMELPVIVSNWPRNVSAEAIRRIGFVPSLSNPVQRPAAQSSRAASSTTTGPSSTSSYDRRDEPVRQPLAITSARGHSGSANGGSDEFGVRSNSQRAIATAPARGSNSSNGSARPDRRSSTAGAGNRFTITNAHEDEIPEEEEDHRVAPAPVPDPQPQRKPESSLQREWPSAEDEKTRLYQQAVKKVEQVQGRVERTDSTHSNRTGPRTAGPASAPVWPSAEEEKIRLFNEARNNALITQGLASAPAGGNVGHARGGSQDSSRSMRQRGFAPSSSAQGQSAALTPGAAMYSEAMSSVRKNATGTPAAWSPTRNDSTSPRPTSAGADTTSLHSTHTPPKRQYPTAEEEKEMMRRYQTATSAVRRHQESHFGSDPGASSSYGAGSSSAPAPEPVHEPAPPVAAAVTPAPPPMDDAPPAWAPGASGFDEAVSEKERYRRAYEAREAAAARSAGSPPPPSIDYAAPPPPADYAEQPPPPIGGSGQQWTFTPPPSIPPHLRQRAPPAPPPSAPGRPMTAAEEKAMLRARFEEEERGSGSRSRPVTPPFNSSLSTESHAPAPGTPPPPPPPPLMPRPPAEYIQETREEDERGLNGFDHGLGLGVAGFGNGDNDDTFGLKLRPSSPFVVGLDSIGRPASRAATVNGSHAMSNGMSKPPLPPKVPL